MALLAAERFGLSSRVSMRFRPLTMASAPPQYSKPDV
jgi:hypothetical protein